MIMQAAGLLRLRCRLMRRARGTSCAKVLAKEDCLRHQAGFIRLNLRMGDSGACSLVARAAQFAHDLRQLAVGARGVDDGR